MEFIVAAVVAILAAGVSYISLDAGTVMKMRIFAVADPDEEYTSKVITKPILITIVVALTIVTFVSVLQIISKVNTVNGIMKMILALLCMVGAGCFDYRECRIPNIFPLVMVAGAVVLLVSGLIFGMSGAQAHITTSVVAATGCALVLVVASFVTKQGIGEGDIKLISALALLTGGYSVMGTLFFGVTTCALYAIVALVMKKKTTSSCVPFGPFLLLGYIIMLFAISF